MKDLIKAIFGTILFMAVIVAMIIGICKYCEHKRYKMDSTTWNNGYCQCGGEWEYQQIVATRANTVYVYKCDKCNNLFKSLTYFKSNP